MRVAMVIQAYYPHVGGAEKQLAALIPLLQRQGIDVHILTRRYPGMKPFESVFGVPVHRIPVPGPKALAALSYTIGCLWSLARLRPDLVHAHELLSPTTTAIAAKRLFHIPIVAKILRGGELGDLAKLKSRGSGQRRINLIRRWVDAFIVISQEIDRELAGIGIEPERRFFIPNGVDIERYRTVSQAEKMSIRARLGIYGDPVAIFTGRFVPEKRVNYLVDMWPAVRRRIPAAELLLLGDGPELGMLRQRAGSGVHFTGEVEDVLPYLQTADLFVLPSSTEGLSNSLLEAMAVGLPCLATSVGGASDLLEHGKSGWIVKPNDPALLEQSVIHLLSEEQLRAGLGGQARRMVSQNYALDKSAQNLLRLYRDLTSIKLPDSGGRYSSKTT